MQTFNLDISVKRVIPLLNAKQGDVGAKILIVLTNDGEEYTIPEDSTWSVWFSGKSGSGNYTTIGEKSAFSANGNKLTVELISQMLNNPGKHAMCLVMNGTDGSQLGLWNIPYYVEEIPGADSEGARQYYQAFLAAQEKAEEAAQVAENAKEYANTAAQTAENAEERANTAAQNAEEAANRVESVLASVDQVTLAQMQELIAGAENISAEAERTAARAEAAAKHSENFAYNKQNKLAWVTDEDIDAMFDGTYEGVENEDPEGDGYLPGDGIEPLLVTLSEDFTTASHSSEEIYNHVKNGGTVYLQRYETLYALTFACSEYSIFSTISDDGYAYACIVDLNGTVREDEWYLGGNGGATPLFVTFDADERQANYTATQIAEHVENGGMAYLCVPNADTNGRVWLPLAKVHKGGNSNSGWFSDGALFGCVPGRQYMVEDTGFVHWSNLDYASVSYVDKAISDAIANLPVYNGELVEDNEAIGKTYNITTNFSGCCGYSDNPTQIDAEGTNVVLHIYLYDGCAFPASIYVSGAEYQWYPSSGTVVLSNPTGAVYVSISAVATGNTYDITVVNNAAATPYSTNPTQISEGETVELVFLTDTVGYATAVGADCEYANSTSDPFMKNLTVTLSNPTGDVTVTIEAGKAPSDIV